MNEARKQKQREYARRYYEEHKEELRKKKNEYRKNNLDKYRKNQKKYYQKNKDYYNNYSKEWNKQKIDNLLKQLEAYENMRKEALKYKNEIKKILDKLNSSQWEKDEEEISYKILFSEEFYKLLNYINDLLNILNKVGEDNDYNS